MKKSFLWLALIMLAGCSASHIFSDSEKMPDSTSLHPMITSNVKTDVLWHINVGRFGHEAGLALTPVTDGKSIYLLNEDGILKIYDTQTGTLEKRIDLEQTITAGLAVGDNLLYAVNRNGEVLGIEMHSGRVHWRIPLNVRILATPVYKDGLLVVRSVDGGIYAFNARNGDRIWQYQINEPQFSVRGNATPIIDGGVVILTTDNGRVYLIDQHTGLPVADQQLSAISGVNAIDHLTDIDATPRLMGSTLFASAYQNATYAMDLQQGRIFWVQPLASSAYNFTVSPKAVYLQNTDGDIFALNSMNGSVLWKNTELHGKGSSAVFPISKQIATVTKDGYLYLFARDSGHIMAQVNVGGSSMVVDPIVLPDRIILTLLDGEMLAIRVHD